MRTLLTTRGMSSPKSDGEVSTRRLLRWVLGALGAKTGLVEACSNSSSSSGSVYRGVLTSLPELRRG